LFSTALGNSLIQFHNLPFPYRRQATLIGDQSVELNSEMLFTTVGERLVIYNPVRFQLIKIDHNDIETEHAVLETKLMVGIGDHLITAPSFSSLAMDGEIKCFTTARISALAGSLIFQIVVFALCDGFVYIRSLPHWKAIRKGCLEGQIATKIHITESVGLVLLLTQRYIFLFTVNGVFVRKVANGALIWTWTGLVSNAGFDYVLYADKENEVGWFEAMYPEKKTSLFRFSELALLHYKKSAQSIVALSTQGRVKIYRFSSELPVSI
jgi:hypothetical protein